jgi:hypothetical protein
VRVSISTDIIVGTCILNVRISVINSSTRNTQKYKNRHSGETTLALSSTSTSSWTALASGSDTSTEMCKSGIDGGEAIMDSKPDAPLNDEEEHDTADDTESSIAQ